MASRDGGAGAALSVSGDDCSPSDFFSAASLAVKLPRIPAFGTDLENFGIGSEEAAGDA